MTDAEPPYPAPNSQLVASENRVAWYAPTVHTYMEFALDGKVTTRVKDWDGDDPQKSREDTPALCDDGNVFVGDHTWPEPKRVERWGVFRLNRENNR